MSGAAVEEAPVSRKGAEPLDGSHKTDPPTREDDHGSGVAFLRGQLKGVSKCAVYPFSKLEVTRQDFSS